MQYRHANHCHHLPQGRRRTTRPQALAVGLAVAAICGQLWVHPLPPWPIWIWIAREAAGLSTPRPPDGAICVAPVIHQADKGWPPVLAAKAAQLNTLLSTVQDPQGR